QSRSPQQYHLPMTESRQRSHRTARQPNQSGVSRILPSAFMSSFSAGKGALMQANTYIAVSLLLTCCLALLTSCQSFSWHLAASKKGDTVELCLSNGDVCPQPGGVSPSSISVYRWDNMHDNELVWDAEPKNPIIAGNISGM